MIDEYCDIDAQGNFGSHNLNTGYQVDATTSNLKNFIDYASAHAGNTSGAPDPSLQLIEDYTATAVNGELQLQSSTPGSTPKPWGLGVTLYRVTLN